MFILRYRTLRPQLQKGFSLLEVVIAIMIIVAMMTLLMNSLGPHMLFKQRMDTGQKLADLQTAMESAYKVNSFNIDNTDFSATDTAFTAYGAIELEPVQGASPARKIETVCTGRVATVGATPTDDVADMNAITGAGVSPLTNLAVLQSYTKRSLQELIRDGFNNNICVLVSRRATMVVNGIDTFYHIIAFIAPGQNANIDPGTKLIVTTPNGVDQVWTLELGGDDQGVVFDGSKVATENVLLTKRRLDNFAKSYETYFKSRYRSRNVRDAQFDYFYSDPNAGNPNNGEPQDGATYTAPPNGYWAARSRRNLGTVWEPFSFDSVISTGAWYVVGINDTDQYDAWGQPLLMDNFSKRVRSGIDAGGAPSKPPYSTLFGAFLPGYTNCAGNPNNIGASCKQFMTSTAVSTY